MTDAKGAGAGSPPDRVVFLRAFDPTLLAGPDESLMANLWGAWIYDQAAQNGIPATSVTDEVAEAIRLKTLSLDTDTVGILWLEKAMKVLAEGDLARAARIFRAGFAEAVGHRTNEHEIRTGSRRQRTNASQPRGDALNSLISSIVSRNPNIRQAGLLEELRDTKHSATVDEVDDDAKVIRVAKVAGGPAATEVRFDALRGRLSREKKKIQNECGK